MNKEQFKAALYKELSGLEEGDLEKSLEFYTEMIDDRMEEGLPEEEAVASLGEVREIATQILSDTPLPKLVFEKAGAMTFEKKTYFVTEEFSGVSVVGQSYDVKILPAESEESKAVCSENEKMYCAVSVSEGVLKIESRDERKWYERVGFFSQTPEITVYLPSGEYRDLTVEATSGKITVAPSFTFATARIKNLSGGVDFRAAVTDELSATTSSGGICLANASPAKLDLNAASGGITVENVNGDADLNVTASSGSVKLTEVICKTIAVKTLSGGIRLDRCDADTLSLEATSGSVRGTLLTEKVFIANTSSGSISVPSTSSGGRCEVRTTSGSIKLEIERR